MTSDGRRYGKVVGKLDVKIARPERRGSPIHIEVEYRLSSSGNFSAEYEGKRYQSDTKAELVNLIRAAVDKTVDVTWQRYLVIDYTATAYASDGDSGRPLHHGSYSDLKISDDRAALSDRSDQRLITGIDLHWTVYDISSPYALPDGKSVRMRRYVTMQIARNDDDDAPLAYEEYIGRPVEDDDDELPAGAVLWTAEREALLREVLRALGMLDARMVEMFRGDCHDLAAKLDAATAGQLLIAPAPKARRG